MGRPYIIRVSNLSTGALQGRKDRCLGHEKKGFKEAVGSTAINLHYSCNSISSPRGAHKHIFICPHSLIILLSQIRPFPHHVPIIRIMKGKPSTCSQEGKNNCTISLHFPHLKSRPVFKKSDKKQLTSPAVFLVVGTYPILLLT